MSWIFLLFKVNAKWIRIQRKNQNYAERKEHYKIIWHTLYLFWLISRGNVYVADYNPTCCRGIWPLDPTQQGSEVWALEVSTCIYYICIYINDIFSFLEDHHKSIFLTFFLFDFCSPTFSSNLPWQERNLHWRQSNMLHPPQIFPFKASNKCKPNPFGNQYHTICCGLSVILFSMERVEGKDSPPELGWVAFDDHGGLLSAAESILHLPLCSLGQWLLCFENNYCS